MKNRILILTLLILIGLFSCATKNYVVCGIGSSMNLSNIDSEIIKLKRIGIADTTIASISGKIYAKSITKNDTLTENFRNINVWFKDIKTDSIIGKTTNSNGEFQFTIPASEYNLEVQFIGYNYLKVKDVKIGSGDIIYFSAIIGQGNGVTEYQWNENYLIEKNAE